MVAPSVEGGPLRPGVLFSGCSLVWAACLPDDFCKLQVFNVDILVSLNVGCKVCYSLVIGVIVTTITGWGDL